MKSKVTQEITVTFNPEEARRIKDLLGEFVKRREPDSYSHAANELAEELSKIGC